MPLGLQNKGYSVAYMSAQAVAKQGPWLNDKHRDAVICTFRFRTARHLLAHGQAYAIYKWYLPAANTTDPDVKLAKGLLHKPCSAEDMPAMHRHKANHPAANAE